MKHKISYFYIIVLSLILIACDSQNVDFSADYSESIIQEFMEDPSSEYINKINNVELVSTDLSRINSGLFEKNTKIVTYVYNVELTLNALAMNLSDLEFQYLLENLPYPKIYNKNLGREENIFSYTSYQYEVGEIHTEFNGDEFIVSSRMIEKNGIEFDPKAEDLNDRREVEKTRKYDVRVNFFGKTYQLNNVTRSEIETFHSQKYNDYKNSVSASLPGTTKAKGKTPINWNKEVEILREYK